MPGAKFRYMDIGGHGGGRTFETKSAATAFSGVSWATAAPELKKNLPPPPERANFKSDESFLEARSGWWKYVMPVLARRYEAS